MRKSQSLIKRKLLKYGIVQTFPPENKPFEEQEVLWRAVIDRALADIIEPTSITDYVDAIEWFDNGGDDFREVCYNASVDPSYVLKIKELLLNTSDEELEL